MSSKEWIQSLKVGDKVVFNGKYHKSIPIITKITKCFVFINDTKFSIKNGSSGSGWDRVYISEFIEGSPEVLALRDKNARSYYIGEIQAFIRLASDKSTDQLKKVYEALPK